VKHIYANVERCEVLTGYLSLGAGLAVNGRICDNGQNGLQSSVQTVSSISHSYCHIFFLIAFLERGSLLEIYYYYDYYYYTLHRGAKKCIHILHYYFSKLN
jgi:hypothetical protein